MLRRNTWSRAGYVIYAGLILLGIMTIVMAYRSDRKTGQEKDIQPVHIEGEYSLNKSAFQTLTPETDPGVKQNNELVIRGHFSEDIEENKELLLRLSNEIVSMRVNGSLIYGNEPQADSFSRSPGNGWTAITSPGITRQDQVELTIQNVYRFGNPQTFRQLLTSMYVGYEGTFIRMQISRYFSSILFAFVSIPMGLLLLFAGMMIRQLNQARIFSLSIFALATGIWIITDPAFMTSFTDNMQTMLVINQIFQFLQLVSITRFAATCVAEKRKNFLNLLHGLTVGLLMLVISCQLTGILDLYDFTLPYVLMIYICCIVISVVFIRETLEGNILVRRTLIAILPLVLFTMIEQVLYQMGHYYEGFSTKLGFSAFLAIQSVFTVREIQNMFEKLENASRVEKELAENQRAVLISQIHPHFLYNALNTIQYLCETKSELAGKTIENLAKFLRGNMDSLSEKEPIPMEQEIAHLKQYLAIESLRFPDIEIKYEFHTFDFSLPALTIQPLVENAIKHGLRDCENGGTVIIRTEEDDENWYVFIMDNGCGFEQKQKVDEGRSHIGIQNTRERIETMSHGRFEIESEIGKGTSVKITLPKNPESCEE